MKLYGDTPDTAIVSVTVEALRGLYSQGFSDGNWDDVDAEPSIEAECWFYRFPAMEKLGEWTNEQQAQKVLSEACEAFNALRDGLWDYETGRRREGMSEADRTAYGMELMDVIHTAETALRMEFGDAEVDGLRDAVEKRTEREDITNGKDVRHPGQVRVGGLIMEKKIGEIGAAVITALVLFLIVAALIKLIVVIVSL